MRRGLLIPLLVGLTFSVVGDAVTGGPEVRAVGEPDEPVDDTGPDDAGVGDDPDLTGDDAGAFGVPSTRERRPLVEVPSGCLASPLPDVVFVGTLVDRDYRTGRFRIRQVRAGDPSPFAADGLIDVRYGLDVQFLQRNERYLVSARRDPVLGVLASRIRPEPPMFGGDDIVGLVESEIVCPGFEDSARTLRPDGSVVDASVVGPLFDRRGELLASLLLPFAVAFGLVFVLASLRLSVTGLARGVGSAAARARR